MPTTTPSHPPEGSTHRADARGRLRRCTDDGHGKRAGGGEPLVFAAQRLITQLHCVRYISHICHINKQCTASGTQIESPGTILTGNGSHTVAVPGVWHQLSQVCGISCPRCVASFGVGRVAHCPNATPIRLGAPPPHTRPIGVTVRPVLWGGGATADLINKEGAETQLYDDNDKHGRGIAGRGDRKYGVTKSV